jgi:hypothetical protein
MVERMGSKKNPLTLPRKFPLAPGRIQLKQRSRRANIEQECARRLRFYGRHGCMPGGGPRWEDDPHNPRKGYNVGTVVVGEVSSVEINVNG